MDKTLVFIDDGFLSKLSKHFGNGKYLKIHRKDFSEYVCKKENLFCSKVFVYTAPPFQTSNFNKEENKRKEGYDKFVSSLIKEGIIIREGRCQRIKNENGEYEYKQKGVDILFAIDLMKIITDFPEIKRIILIASDSDFVPIIHELYSKKIKTILYTYFDRDRNSPFSRSNNLIKSVSKYVKLTKEDFVEISK